MAELKLRDQVIVRRPLLNARGSNLVKLGTIVAFAENGKKAVVSFQADNTRATIALDQLTPATSRLKQARINPRSLQNINY